MSARPLSTECPFCGGYGKQLFNARDRNRETTDDVFAYIRCATCQTVFLRDPPADLGRYYAEDYYQFDSTGEPAWKVDPIRRESASWRVKLLCQHTDPGHLIEIGAGTGAFALAAKEVGFDVSVIEMSKRCCQYLDEQDGIEAICSDRPLNAIAKLSSARVVALWHVLEHLANPAEVLTKIVDKLEPGGLLALAVPNPNSLQFRVLRTRWAHLDAPRHLCLVPPDALIGMGVELGLRPVELTTNDPDGLECNFFGWISALRSRPAEGSISVFASHSARVLERLVAPLERSGNRGAAVTILMRRER